MVVVNSGLVVSVECPSCKKTEWYFYNGCRKYCYNCGDIFIARSVEHCEACIERVSCLGLRFGKNLRTLSIEELEGRGV
jgi:hypothetical protein